MNDRPRDAPDMRSPSSGEVIGIANAESVHRLLERAFDELAPRRREDETGPTLDDVRAGREGASAERHVHRGGVALRETAFIAASTA